MALARLRAPGILQAVWLFAACCLGPCAISGYEYGDPWEGVCQGSALMVTIIHILSCGHLTCIYTVLFWQPTPENLKNDAEQRKVMNKCFSALCVGPSYAMGFYEYGDLCWSDVAFSLSSPLHPKIEIDPGSPPRSCVGPGPRIVTVMHCIP